MKLDRAAVRAYLDRPWAAQAAQKLAYWRARKAQGGPAEILRVADALRRQAILLDPSWPSEKDRAEDLQTHQRVAETLARATAAHGAGARRIRRVR